MRVYLVGEAGWAHLVRNQLFVRIHYGKLSPGAQTLLGPLVLPEAHPGGTLVDASSFTPQEKTTVGKALERMGLPWPKKQRTEPLFQFVFLNILEHFFGDDIGVTEENKVPYACMPGHRLCIPDIAVNCRGAALDSGITLDGEEKYVPATAIRECKGDIDPADAEPQLAMYLGGHAVVLMTAGVPANQVRVVGFALASWQVVFAAVTLRPNPNNPAATQLVYTRVLDFGRLDLESPWQANAVARLLVGLARSGKELDDKLKKHGAFLFRAATNHFDNDDDGPDDGEHTSPLAEPRRHHIGSDATLDATISSSPSQEQRSKHAEVLEWVGNVGVALPVPRSRIILARSRTDGAPAALSGESAGQSNAHDSPMHFSRSRRPARTPEEVRKLMAGR
ncbi:uncharacterized protein EV422DRAFT_605045 [Fimicolochytrium jonesii]|uniref:uncharacterized protein n=1 Tax=Fimicolochytrium jonesii TaxID=1396493 RepID=UPI0022FE92D8|nr:uncharacterized protein EV422DRAFT_605045 [Fimicolochytrium jonesii]KAI8824772.1 hypothetical protein EV422DRAFT_605045 [Fimicolochytrium jonesii]